MTTLLLVVGAYLLVGIIAVALLDLFTGRVRERIKAGAYETQILAGDKRLVAIIITVLALWLFWPFAIYAAVFQSGGKRGA